MRLAHIADLHCSREHTEEALASLRFLAEHIKKSPVDLVCIAGDTWDASMLNTESSGFNRFVDATRDIADLAPVAMIYGTPSHDTDGSLEVFRKITCKYAITILEPGQAYFLGMDGITDDEEWVLKSIDRFEPPKAILFGIPEPRKKYLLADGAAGKAETEEALRDALHRLCFHLAAKRREYPDIPCVVLYHGEVAGAKFQNDMTVERGTGIAITIDDLADIGADYYALGHIHKPQQVGNLPAYYAGSIYPRNFGESHQAGFNVVEIDQGMPYDRAAVARVNFPHPQNVKIETSDLMTYDVPDGGIKGKRVWLEFTCAKEQRALIDTEAELRQLLKNGAVPGSRVTINELPTETVRAADITEAQTPEKKLQIWAEQSQVPITEDHLSKAARLAGEISEKSGAPTGEWELVSVRLRGATGIQRGIGKDEIFLDFDSYDPGLIALCGENGKGKTTLIENCHPYPQLLTRRGKLQDHFCLKDSFREVVYREGSTFYKFLIQIDGQNKSGSCKYFIFNKKFMMENFEPFPGIDGNLKPYEEFVLSTLGPLELYLRTAFTTQRPTRNLPDLTDATQGDKKALFTALAGIDYLQLFADVAASYQKQEQARAHDAELKADMLTDAVSRKEELAGAHGAERGLLASLEQALEKIAADGQAAKAELEKAQAASDAEKERERQYQAVQEGFAKLQSDINCLNYEKNSLLELSEYKVKYQKQIGYWEKASETVRQETEKKSQIAEKNAQKQAEYVQKLKEFNEIRSNIDKAKNRLAEQKNEILWEIQTKETAIQLHERDAEAFDDTCPTCGQVLPEESIKMLRDKQERALEFIAAHKEEIVRFRKELEAQDEQIKQAEKEFAEVSFGEPRPEPSEKFDDSTLRYAQKEMSAINIDEIRNLLSKASEAGIRIEGIERQLADKAPQLKEKLFELNRILDSANPAALDNFEAARRRHEELSENYRKAREAIAVSRERIANLETQIKDIEAKENLLADCQAELGEAASEAAEWELIVRAFGRDGIQALELDALAPGITGTANRILDSAFGGRFHIGIETTRIGGAGRKTRQIEDFIITVSDLEAGGEPVPLEMKSGGESVWIKRAIYDAFAVIRKRNTGFNFRTCFQDEADGALDSAAKASYCRMLEAAHAESKLRHTVIITHSEEVKAMIPQKINMEGLS